MLTGLSTSSNRSGNLYGRNLPMVGMPAESDTCWGQNGPNGDVKLLESACIGNQVEACTDGSKQQTDFRTMLLQVFPLYQIFGDPTSSP